ncbi:MAG: type I-C CRISPR-associated endonuclease Cas1c [Clostridiales bacterium]|jgi:CRISPR-associated protein Cas1|nr:type I-C CRISPR-associated endonuclease Cas1c [Clostridiales bacterium]
MRILLNTLFVTVPDAYLSLDGENIVILQQNEVLKRLPLHNFESIVTFGYPGASPALMGKCAGNGISLCFLTEHGRFLAEVSGMERGNVLLRKTQYRISDDEAESAKIAVNFLTGKLFNSRWVLERAARDYPLRLDVEKLKRVSKTIADDITLLQKSEGLPQLRGIEGEAAARYFSVFDDLILQNKEDFFFRERSRRPPMDNLNALLSFFYTLLANDIASALRAAGLDPYVGFLHRDRPGRQSLALDMLEELRSCLADRFVLTLINTKQVNASGFVKKENGAVIMNDATRREILSAWQKRKQEQIVHPFLKEKLPWGLVPHAQALLLARFLRGDLDAYPPFFWK